LKKEQEIIEVNADATKSADLKERVLLVDDYCAKPHKV